MSLFVAVRQVFIKMSVVFSNHIDEHLYSTKMVYSSAGDRKPELTISEAKRLCSEKNAELSHCTPRQKEALKGGPEDGLSYWCTWHRNCYGSLTNCRSYFEDDNSHRMDRSAVIQEDTSMQQIDVSKHFFTYFSFKPIYGLEWLEQWDENENRHAVCYEKCKLELRVYHRILRERAKGV